MPVRYYTIEEIRNSPSARDGVDFETEATYRREGVIFIIETGFKAGFAFNTIITAVVYFHRFYLFHSFRKFSACVIACGCLFIAGNSEQTPKRRNDIKHIAKGILTDEQFITSGLNSTKVLKFERIILRTIKTDQEVKHPYEFIIEYMKNFEGDKAQFRQIAWNFVTDSLCTTLPVQYKPEVIAKAALHLAGKICESQDSKYREQSHLKWCEDLVADVSEEILEDIGNQILYAKVQHDRPSSKPQSDSTPSVENRVTPDSSVDVYLSSKGLVSSTFSKVYSTYSYLNSRIKQIDRTLRKADLIYICITTALKHYAIASAMWRLVKGKKKNSSERLFYVSRHIVTAITSFFNSITHISSSYKDIRTALQWISSAFFYLFRTLKICF